MIRIDIRNFSFLFVCVGLSCWATVVAADELKIGVFQADVSPPVGSPLAYDPCAGVAMPLEAKGLVIIGADAPIVLCAVDWIGISNAAHTEWRTAIARAAETSVDRVTVHTLHQHDAPFCDFAADAILAERGLSGMLFDVKFSQRVITRVADAVAAAKQDAETITHIGVGVATVEKVASNRRILGADGTVRVTRYTACRDPLVRLEPEGTIDPRLKSLSFFQDDQAIAVLTYYATHPQSYYRRGIANPDFPGMARFLRQVTLNGLPHVHFNGAGGNIGAGKYNDGSEDNRQTLATRLAEGMRAAWQRTTRTPLTGEDVRWSTVEVAIPPAPHLQEEQLVSMLDDESATAAQRGAAATDLAWLRRCRRGGKVAVSALRLGPATILHLPGEAVVEYQLFAQNLHPERPIAVAAYGDYGTGYICLEKHYTEGGYEASPRASRVAPHSEAVLKDAIVTVLQNTK